MAQIYTTQELAQILAQEQAACLRGDRLSLTATATHFNPVLEPFVNVEGVQKFRAFCDFREAVQAYQRQHQISGLRWLTFTAKGCSLNYPEVDEHLAALPQDLDLLAAYKPKVFQFWQRLVQGMDTYCQRSKQGSPQLAGRAEIEAQVQRAEWAYLHKLDYGATLELTVQLGWGNPKDALYQKHWPLSGCCFIHAVERGQLPQSRYY